MALLGTEEAIGLLLKHILQHEESNAGKFYFEEGMLDDRVWTQKGDIPGTAPTLADGETSGVVKRHIELELTQVPGNTNAYYNNYLANAIHSKYGDGESYKQLLTYNDGTAIPEGAFKWIKIPRSKILYFYDGAPSSNMPPKFSFFEYVGTFDEFTGTAIDGNADEKYRNSHDPSSGELPSSTSGSGENGAIMKGDFWRMSSDGEITGLSPEPKVNLGDLLYAKVDGAANSDQFFAISRNIILDDYLLANSTLLPEDQDQADAIHNSESPSSANPFVTESKLNSSIYSIGQLVGEFDASVGALPTSGSGEGGAIVKSDYWRVTTAGAISGLSPVENLEVGDVLHASVNNASDASEFFAVQANVNWDEKADIDDARFPTTDEKAAMTASLNPSGSNPFVTSEELNSATLIGTFAGNFDASPGTVPGPTEGSGSSGAIIKGDYWRVTTAGAISGLVPFTGLENGDLIYANKNSATAVADFFAIKGIPFEPDSFELVLTANTTSYVVMGDTALHKAVIIDYTFVRGLLEGNGRASLTDLSNTRVMENNIFGDDHLVAFSKEINGTEIRLNFDDTIGPNANDTIFNGILTYIKKT